MSQHSKEPDPFPDFPDWPTSKYPPYLNADDILDAPPMDIGYREPDKKKVPKYVEIIASIIATLIILGIGAIAVLFLVSIIIQIVGRM